MARNTENLILNTLMLNLVEVTGIPSGRIYVKMPDVEFVNMFDGSKQPQTNTTRFPSIGFTYYSDPLLEYNNYGSYVTKKVNGNTTKEYDPLGEITLYIAIHLFTKTAYDQDYIGNNILMELMDNKYYYFIGDEIADEYFSVKFRKMRDFPEHEPYHKLFLCECNARILKEVTGYTVKEVDTTFETGTKLVNEEVVGIGSDYEVKYKNTSSDLLIDTFTQDGDFERTIEEGNETPPDLSIIYFDQD